jgi:autotransporter-associated beta strand protein
MIKMKKYYAWAAAMVLSGLSLSAGTHVWTGASTNYFWSNPANWQSNNKPVLGEAAPVVIIFPSTAASTASLNDIHGMQVDRIEVHKAFFTIDSRTNAMLILRGNGLSLTNSADLVHFRPTLGLIGSNVFASAGYKNMNIGSFSGSGSLLLRGGFPNPNFLWGTGATYTGSVQMESGYANLTRINGPFVGSSLTVAKSYTPYQQGFVYPKLRILEPNQIPDTTPVTINPGGVIEVVGVTEAVGPLTMAGGELTTVSNGVVRLTANITAKDDSEIGGILSLGLESRTITVQSQDDTLEISAAITGLGGVGFAKDGNGSLTLYGTNIYNGSTAVLDGTLGVFAPTASSDFSVSPGAQLIASAPIGNLLLNGSLKMDGWLYGGYTENTVSCKGLLATASSAIHVTVSTPTTGQGTDVLKVTGTVWLQGGALRVGNTDQVVLPPGQVRKILDNDGVDNIMGSFYGLPEAGIVQDSKGNLFRISYVGGDGNDVTLTTVASQDVQPPVLKSITRLPNGHLRLDGTGTPFMAYKIEMTQSFGEDLGWGYAGKIVASYNGALTFTFTNTMTWDKGFFRFALPGYLF